MQLSIIPRGQTTVINEVGPLLVYALAFVIAVGGVYAAAVLTCGSGHVEVANIDFWKAVVKIQCK